MGLKAVETFDTSFELNPEVNHCMAAFRQLSCQLSRMMHTHGTMPLRCSGSCLRKSEFNSELSTLLL